jgi:uncharacterized protein
MLTGGAIFWAMLRLAAVLVVAGGLIFAAVVYLMAMALLQPPRMVGGRAFYFLKRLTPEDLGLGYETRSFTVRDERTGKPLRLAAWWLAHPDGGERCAIVLHGYADSKIGGLAWVPVLRSLGYHVLALDLRAHGQSEGRYTTAGFYERHDLMQVIDQFKAAQPAETRRLVLFGVSLGAAVAAATAAMRDDLAAVVMECPYVDFPSAVMSHADELPVPGRVFQVAALWLCAKIGKVDYQAVRPGDMIGKIGCPVWVVQVDEDPFISVEGRKQIAAAVAERRGRELVGETWMAENSFHVLALADHPEEYRRRLGEFLAQAVATEPVGR